MAVGMLRASGALAALVAAAGAPGWLTRLLLAATAHGLGSALTTIATVFADDLAAIVGFPDSVVPLAVVPIGHPSRPLGSSRREPVEDHAHREEFGRGW